MVINWFIQRSYSYQSSKYYLSQTVWAWELKFWENVHPPPRVTCQMSRVTDHVDVHVDIFFKHHLEELKEGLVNNLYSIRFGKTPVVRNANYYSSKKILFRFFWATKKGTNLIKFPLKDFKKICYINNFSFIWWDTLLTNISYEPHGTCISGFTFLLNQEIPKNHNQFCHFCHGDIYLFIVSLATVKCSSTLN